MPGSSGRCMQDPAQQVQDQSMAAVWPEIQLHVYKTASVTSKISALLLQCNGLHHSCPAAAYSSARMLQLGFSSCLLPALGPRFRIYLVRNTRYAVPYASSTMLCFGVTCQVMLHIRLFQIPHCCAGQLQQSCSCALKSALML